MKRSTVLVVVAAVMFFAAFYTAPLNENGQLDFVNHFRLACLTITLMIPAFMCGIKFSFKCYKEVAKEERATEN